MQVHARAALLDIEGTLGSMSFVRDVLFPYARERMDAFVRQRNGDPQVRLLLDDAACEASVPADDLDGILAALHRWADADQKVTSLKALQGIIWVEGYEQAGIRGHLYADSIDALRRFANAGVELYIYSSGSVPAQKLLFGNSVAGDLIPLFRGFYDTTIGSKRERDSYERIAREAGIAPADIVFFSDNAHELDAAALAGMQTVQLARPQDGTTASDAHTAIESFDGVEIVA